MGQFDYLKKLDVKGDETAEFKLLDLPAKPKLILAIAGEKNKPYLNASLKAFGSQLNSRRRTRMDADTMSDTREADRALYAQYVIKGWEGITDTKGEEVPFNKENCLEFLEILPDYIFDDIRVFAGDPTNFVQGEIDSHGTGKNSRKG